MQTDVLFRLDPRLVHATLMNAWVPHHGAELIVVADGRVVEDHRLRNILEMSAMDTEVLFTSEERLASTLEQAPEQPMIVLFSSLASVLLARSGGAQIDRLNLGHLPKTGPRTEIHPSVFLGPDDREKIAALEAQGCSVYVQPLPDDAMVAPLEAVETEVRDRLTIINERGLHLRAAHVFAQLAGRLAASVQVGRGKDLVNAKSLLGLTTLGASCGTVLDVVVKGEDAEAAMAQIRALFASGFDEGATA